MQTFIKVIKHIDKIKKFRCPEIAGYCVIIVRHESYNILRQRKKMMYIDENNQFELQDHTDIEALFINKLDQRLLHHILNALAPEDRQLIYLRFMYEMTYRQIGACLDISEEAAKKRGQRLVEKLRKKYQEGTKDD